MDRFDDLTTFALVSELQSVRQAADVLGRAPSAVSRRIKDLEQRLHVQLLTRTTRKIALTSAGERFYADARRILDELEEAETRVAADTQAVSGEIRMTMPLSFGLAHLAPAIADFMSLHSKVRFDADLNDRAINLIENRIDLAIRIGTLSDSTLKARRLAPIHQVVVAAPSFWAEHGIPRVPDKLSGLPALCYSNLTSPNVWSWSNAQGKQGKVTLETRYRASNGDALVQAAIRGMGIIRLPTFIVNDAIEAGDLQPVLLTTNWGMSELYALYPNTAYLPHRCRVFIDFLTERFGGQPAWDDCLRVHLRKLARSPKIN
ncbi:MAG: LysR family transcriptional regulator [Granulosicoccus sp.]